MQCYIGRDVHSQLPVASEQSPTPCNLVCGLVRLQLLTGYIRVYEAFIRRIADNPVIRAEDRSIYPGLYHAALGQPNPSNIAEMPEGSSMLTVV